MTGYGRGEVKKKEAKITAEVSSLNSRFLELSLRLPKFLSGLEFPLRELIGQKIARGKVTVALKWEEKSRAAGAFDTAQAKAFLDWLKKARRKFKLKGELELEHLLYLPWWAREDAEAVPEGIWEPAAEAVERAIDAFNRARRDEGKRLQADFKKRLGIIKKEVAEIEKETPEHKEAYRQKLENRMKELLGEGKFDAVRVAQEAAILSERSDVTEEIVRLKSHLEGFEKVLGADEPVGKKLGFFLQEMGREANTLGSKALSASVARRVIAVKEELEKLREQLQNVE
jgi:uncharacterized protein (TIGR00255 family)